MGYRNLGTNRLSLNQILFVMAIAKGEHFSSYWAKKRDAFWYHLVNVILSMDRC